MPQRLYELIKDPDREKSQGEGEENPQAESQGGQTYEEKVVLGAFLTMAALLVTRSSLTINDLTIHGWEVLFPDASFLDDGTVAITVALTLFIIPARSRGSRGEFVMGADVIAKLPWDIIILLGG